jgi:hypothetical protein
MQSIPIPIVQAAGTAFNLLSTVTEAVGGNVNKNNKEQAEDMGVKKGARIANNIAALFPGVGFLNKKIEEGQKSPVIDSMSNAYADTVSDINSAQTLGGGKALFGKKQIEAGIEEANRKNKLLTEIGSTNTMRKQSDYGKDLAQQNLNRYSGTNYMDMRMGKFGMKLSELDRFRALLRNRITESEEIQKFADGGSILPQGKLHKELHHMGELNEKFEDLTRKGIPVVTLNEGGELVQVAEIERDE